MTERSALITVTGAVALLGLVVGLATGNLVGFYFPFSEGVLAIATSATGAVITARRSRHAVGRLLLWVGLVLATAQLLAAFAPGSVSDPMTTSGGVGSLVSALQFASLVMLTALIARFPDGTWTTRWSRALFLAFAVLVVGHVGLLVSESLGWWDVPAVLAVTVFRMIPLLGLVLTAHVVIHLLRSDPTRRRQMAWVLVAFVLALTPEAIIEGFDLSPGPVGEVVRGLLVLLIPVSIGVAVTRYRLYEIDRVVSRTLSYGIVVAMMAVVFGGVLVGLGLILGGQDDVTVAIATLAAVGVSVPLVHRVRSWVDRRFFRYRYDAATVVARVADDLRTTVDLDEVEARTEAVIDEVFSPEAVGVWLAGRSANPGS